MKMFVRKLSTIYKRNLNKYISTLTLNKTEAAPVLESDSKDSVADLIKNKENSIFESPDYFKVHNLFTVKDLFDARVHYGHKDTSLNNKMKPFLFGSRLGHIIFDLDITAYHLREALNFAAHIAYRDGIILFVSKNPRVTLMVEKTALECKEFAVTREWRDGVFSNSYNIFNCVTRLPDLLIILNTTMENGMEHPGVAEAARMCIPTIGIVDSNCNPNIITYPVPGNDDSYQSVALYCNLFKNAILRGKNERKKDFPSPEQELVTNVNDDKKLEDIQTVINKNDSEKLLEPETEQIMLSSEEESQVKKINK